MNEPHVVILGGGITGLVAAYRLRELNHAGILPVRCTVIEKDARFGGKIQTRTTEEYTLELGPDSIFTRKPAGVEFIREIGLTQDVIPVSPSSGTFVMHHGRLQPLPPGVNTGVPTDLGAFVKTRLLSAKGKLRALIDLFLPYKPFAGDVSLGSLLRKRLGDEVVDVIASPLLAGIHAGDIDRLSLNATMPMWRKMYEEHRSLILAAMKQKKKAPAPSPTSAGPVFINLKGGLEQLVNHVVHLVEDYADLHMETKAIQIIKSKSGRYEVVIEKNGRQSVLEADAVIVATPAFAAADILSGLHVHTDPLKSIRYANTATVSFGYHTKSGAHKISGTGFLVPRNEKATITACTIVSSKWSNSSKNGNLLVRCYVGRDGDEEAVEWDDDRLVQATLNDLKNTIGLTDTPNFIEIKRWNHSMPQYDVGHLERVQEIEKSLESLPGIVLAGAAYRGIGIPDCITDASKAVERIKSFLLHTE